MKLLLTKQTNDCYSCYYYFVWSKMCDAIILNNTEAVLWSVHV